MAHEVGGADLDRRLRALADDRTLDVQGRKDARSRQAGVRFARRFVLLVPLGMAMVGPHRGHRPGGVRHAVGPDDGPARASWPWSPAGPWAGRLMRLPEEERVFYE